MYIVFIGIGCEGFYIGEVCYFFREMEYGGVFIGKIYGILFDSFFKNEEWGYG